MPGPQRTCGYTGLYLIDNLPVNRDATLQIEGEAEGPWRIGLFGTHL